jgi:Enoyl-CoA hydratase/isomerase
MSGWPPARQWPAIRNEGDTMSDSIVVTDDGAVRVIRMNRPEKKNALTQPMYAAMTGAMREAEANAAIRCLVLAGGQSAFCAGADIGEFLESAQSGARIRWNFSKRWPTTRSRWSPRSAALPSASAPPCCSTAITSSPPPMPPSPRRS